MSEPLGPDRLLDPALLEALGPLEPDIVDAIVGICNDALAATLGPAIVDLLDRDPRLVSLVAPWSADLARGLVVLHKHGPAEHSSADLLGLLSRNRISGPDRTRYAETVDLAAILTLDRVLEHVLGPGAGARSPRENDEAAPWLRALTYGHRIHLSLELLRLLPAG